MEGSDFDEEWSENDGTQWPDEEPDEKDEAEDSVYLKGLYDEIHHEIETRKSVYKAEREQLANERDKKYNELGLKRITVRGELDEIRQSTVYKDSLESMKQINVFKKLTKDGPPAHNQDLYYERLTKIDIEEGFISEYGHKVLDQYDGLISQLGELQKLISERAYREAADESETYAHLREIERHHREFMANAKVLEKFHQRQSVHMHDHRSYHRLYQVRRLNELPSGIEVPSCTPVEELKALLTHKYKILDFRLEFLPLGSQQRRKEVETELPPDQSNLYIVV